MQNTKCAKYILKLANQLRREFDDTGTRICLLHFVLNNYLDKDIFQKDIEEELNVRSSSISNILGKMEEEQLIIRERVAYDDRLKSIKPTKLAIKMKKKVDQDVQLLEDKLTHGIADEELKLFLQIAKKMMKNISE